MSIQDRNRRQAHHDRAVGRRRHEPSALLMTVRYPIRRWCEGMSSFNSAQFGPAQTTSAGWRVPASDEGVWAETESEYDPLRIHTPNTYSDGAKTGLRGYVVSTLIAGCCYLDDRGRVGMYGRALHLAPVPVSRFGRNKLRVIYSRLVDSAHAQATDPRSESVLDEFR